ncbi:GTP-binding protein ypt3 [Phytophthora cinnamomi]|uniref:GTP-binding protein ypt3 n=1 Tax=Phytophthora cinnamomi TaxID=4785 RepID=UPI0035596CA9|nr:GTP-binding protein ypt3 [Phytophthora cinnamomi]
MADGSEHDSFEAAESASASASASPSPSGSGASSLAPWSVRIHDKRAKAFRFTAVTDVALLREVMAHRPWASSHGDMAKTWEAVATAFKRTVPWSTNDGRACKRRYLALAEAFGSDKLQKLRGSGTPDMNAEREALLARCQALTDDDHRRRKAAKEADRRPVAQLALEDAARLSGNVSPEIGAMAVEAARAAEAAAGAAAGATGQDLTLLLNDPRVLLRQRELELEERRMKLEERRVKLEEQRFEQQRQTAEKQLEMMAAQTNVLLKLADKLAGPQDSE